MDAQSQHDWSDIVVVTSSHIYVSTQLPEEDTLSCALPCVHEEYIESLLWHKGVYVHVICEMNKDN